MPIYEYRCSVCGESFEKLVRTTSGPVEVRCPYCDADRVERQVSMFGLSSGSRGGSYGYSSSSGGCATVGG